jgi:hypothetical protein
MNERIRQLATEAGASKLPGDELSFFGNDSIEKFAELIVAEMLQTCEDHPAWTGRMIGEEIKEHFGVE